MDIRPVKAGTPGTPYLRCSFLDERAEQREIEIERLKHQTLEVVSKAEVFTRRPQATAATNTAGGRDGVSSGFGWRQTRGVTIPRTKFASEVHEEGCISIGGRSESVGRSMGRDAESKNPKGL